MSIELVPRTVYLVVVAMLMFAGGVVVLAIGKGLGEHVLGGIAVLGALAVVLANVNGHDKP